MNRTNEPIVPRRFRATIPFAFQVLFLFAGFFFASTPVAADTRAYMAILGKDYAAAQRLLTGTNLEHVKAPFGKAPTFPLACEHGDEDPRIIRLLMKRKVNPKQVDPDSYDSSCLTLLTKQWMDSATTFPDDWTIKDDHSRLVKELIAYGVPVDPAILVFEGNRSCAAFSALMQAAKIGHLPVVRLLVEAGAVVDLFSNWENQTALMFAAGGGHQEVVRYLLARGADRNLKDRGGLTAYEYAQRGGHTEVAALLQPEQPKSASEQFAIALTLGDAVRVQKIIHDVPEGKRREFVNQPIAGHHPLYYTIRPELGEWDQRKLQVFDLLVREGADINAVTPPFNMSITMMIVYKQNLPALRHILTLKPELNVVGEGACIEGMTALTLAIQNQDLEAVKVLAGAGASAKVGMNPFHLAVFFPHAIIFLLENKHLDMDYSFYEALMKEWDRLKKKYPGGTPLSDHEEFTTYSNMQILYHYFVEHYSRNHAELRRRGVRFRGVKRPTALDPDPKRDGGFYAKVGFQKARLKTGRSKDNRFKRGRKASGARR